MNDAHSVIMKVLTSKLPKPRMKPKEIRKHEIQVAARKVFFKKGYQASTITEIANNAGIQNGTVYLYFKNKEDLYLSLMIPAVQRVGHRLKKLENAILQQRVNNGFELMNIIVEAHLDLYEHDREGVKIIQAFLQGALFAGVPKNTIEHLNDLARNNFQTIRRIICLGKDCGFLKKEVNEFLLADIIWAIFLGVFQVEENKFRMTKKNYFYSTVKYGFSLVTEGVLPKT